MDSAISILAKRISVLLERNSERLVLAESCTGGLIAAQLTEVPGISKHFCGSHVTYREDSKTKWLGVKTSTLKKFSAVSAEVAEEMVQGALRKTPEASISASVTGYLGPTGNQIGLIYISVLRRGSKKPITVKLDLKNRSRLKNREQATRALLLLLVRVMHLKTETSARD